MLRRPSAALRRACEFCFVIKSAPYVPRRPSAALAESPLDLGAMTSSEGDKLLIDTAAEKDLESKPRITTKSGLEYQEFVAGKGPTPTVGIQVCLCLSLCVAITHEMRQHAHDESVELFSG